jgi:hypothetical protein
MAVDTALINWNVLLQTPADGPLPQVWVPAYALYGGPGYSGGEVIDEEGEVPDFSVKPANKIDAYFRLHDLVYYDLEATEFERAQADVLLAQNLLTVPDHKMSGEDHLYVAGTLVAVVYQISAGHDLTPLQRFSLLSQLPGGPVGVVGEAVEHLQQASVNPDQSEIAGFLQWLSLTGGAIETALGSLDVPFLSQAADEIGAAIEDVIASYAGPLTSPLDLETSEFDFTAALPDRLSPVEVLADQTLPEIESLEEVFSFVSESVDLPAIEFSATPPALVQEVKGLLLDWDFSI